VKVKVKVKAIAGRARDAHPVLLRLVAALVVLVGVYVGVAAFLGDHVPANARVDGIAIGGMSPGEAKVTLKRLLVTKASSPVHLAMSSLSSLPSRTIDIQPAAAGLEIDLEATLSDLTGFTMNPVRLWAHLTAKNDHLLKPGVDRGKLSRAVTTAARAFDSPVREGSITFTAGKATKVPSVVGREVEVPATVDAVVSRWPDRPVVQAVVKLTQPKVSPEEIERAALELAVPAMSAPVKVVLGSPVVATVILQPKQYAPALSATPDSTGSLRLSIDTPKLMAVLRAAAPALERTPVDATVRLVAGEPVVVPAVVGSGFDRKTAAAPFLAALTSGGRTARLTLVRVSPHVTTATAQGWGIREVTSTFTTQFPVNPPRTNNIRIAVARLNGTLVRPGAQFSLNATLGERTPAKGYRQAPVIYAGRLVSDFGGGVSQVSTTTFNAAFFAGVRMDRYTPHSFYIARYPEGREATVSWPGVDQKWTNDTGFGILIRASVSGSNLTVSFLGTPTWQVEAVKGPRRNVVQPKNIVDARADCVPQFPTPGFDVTVTRIFKKNGAVVKTAQFNTHYIPENNVKCTNPAP